MEWLKDIFSGWTGLGAAGVIGVILLFSGAIVSLAPGKKTPKRIVVMKFAGMGLVLLGLIIIIAFGKY
ncbi:MAG: hypothetical protein IJC48_08995 [Clostridia bacterium]|nr:hypothetical protein [Clostridia bacterium]